MLTKPHGSVVDKAEVEKVEVDKAEVEKAEAEEADGGVSGRPWAFPVLVACFVLSGVAGLVYQTAWAQQLTLVFGASEQAVAAVLASYMAGLAVGAGLAGRLIDTNGRPLADQDIHLLGEYEGRFDLSGPLDTTVADSYVTEREGRTDAEGRFAFGDLAPGSYAVGAGPSGQSFLQSDALRVRAGEERTDLEIVLDAGWEISGEVVDEAGEPLSGIVVTIFPEPPTEGRMAQILTGADGIFREAGFALGTYRFEIASTELREDHDTRPLKAQSLRDVDPFGAAMRIVLEAE